MSDTEASNTSLPSFVTTDTERVWRANRATVIAQPAFTSPLHLVWNRLSRPFNLVHVIPALCGVPPAHVADLIVLHVALSSEAAALVQATPELLRHLTSSTTIATERVVGAITGPVIWAETLTARANGGGAEDVFVCGSPERDFSTPENRILAAALQMIVRASTRLDSDAAQETLRSDQRDTIRTRGDLARRLLQNNHLKMLRTNRPSPRDVTSARQGRHGAQFQPALDMWSRRHEPIHPDELLACTDAVTRGQQRALALVMMAVQRRGLAVPQFTVLGGELVAGIIRYRNHLRSTQAGNHGVLLGNVLVDGASDPSPAARRQAIASLEARSGDRVYCLVTSEAEAEVAADLALDGTRWAH